MLKYTCKIWTWGFNCKYCPNQCPQSCHYLSDTKYEKKEYIEYIKVEDVIGKKDDKLNYGINPAKKLLKSLLDEEMLLRGKIEITQTELKKKSDELNKIAINCTSYQTTIEFLEELILEEETQKEKGYKERILLYRRMIEENKVLLENMHIS